MKEQVRPAHDETPVLTPSEARQSSPTGHVRYILGISLGLSVLAFIAVWVFGVI